MTLKEKLQAGLVYCDGGMGTMLQAAGLATGERSETWNLTHPEAVQAIHEAYFAAGSDLVCANTFGANRFHCRDGAELEAVVTAGVRLACQARDRFGGDRYVALDIGSTGKLLEPLGDLPFEDAVAAFAEVVRIGAAAGADLIYIETMNDSYETKAAVLAAKENCDLPVFVTTVYNESGRLMTGADPAAMAAMLEGLGADAIGMNCSLGPAQMVKLTPALCACASVPVIVCPNAGLPRMEQGSTIYDVNSTDFSAAMVEIVRAGARVVGGCCGTTPDYIRALVAATKDLAPAPLTAKGAACVSSRTHAAALPPAEELPDALPLPCDEDALEDLADDILDLTDDGAEVVALALPEAEPEEIAAAVRALQTTVDVPLLFASGDAAALEAALRAYNGRAAMQPTGAALADAPRLAAKYGAIEPA